MDIPALLVLSRLPGIGPRRLRRLVERFGTAEAVLGLGTRTLVHGAGLDETTARAVVRAGSRPEFRARAARQLDRLARQGGRVVTLWDPAYPDLLGTIPDPPPLLFVRGDLKAARTIAVVGTRRPTPSGVHHAIAFASRLASAGLTVVSGLARGIDTLAHRAALDAGERTIAVLGSGIDVIYPPENAALAERIAGRGALVSELEPGTRPHATHFPRRNRIISGMCPGTLVVETAPRGGAMITAGLALEQNREVFALPTGVESGMPSGTNLLIKRGEALLVEDPEEILRELEPVLAHRTPRAASPSPPT